MSQSSDSVEVSVRPSSGLILNSSLIVVENCTLMVNLLDGVHQSVVVLVSLPQLKILGFELGDEKVLLVAMQSSWVVVLNVRIPLPCS
jgi:hypothetical protein